MTLTPSPPVVAASISSSRKKLYIEPSCHEFLCMAAAAKARLPPIDQPAVLRLSLWDATPLELVYLIHEQRQKYGAEHSLGPYTLQQAACLHFASRLDISDLMVRELEETARIEDERLAFLTGAQSAVEDQVHIVDRQRPCSPPWPLHPVPTITTSEPVNFAGSSCSATPSAATHLYTLTQ